MPKFRVTLQEEAYYQIEVEAETAEQAADDAEATFVQSADLSEFAMWVDERGPYAIEEVVDAKTS